MTLRQGGGDSPDGRKVKSTIHWVNANDYMEAEVRLYDRLFRDENPEKSGRDFIENLNPDSFETLRSCKLEKSLLDAEQEKVFQFERLGYFCLDSKERDSIVFNRTVTLKDSWAKLKKF